MLNGIKFLRATPADIAYIDSSWGQSYASGSDAGRALGFHQCLRRHEPIRKNLLKCHGAWVAKRATGIILGWCVGTPYILHYVYVVRDFRRAGIATQLLRDTGLLTSAYYSHHTRDMRHICKKFKMKRADLLMHEEQHD